MKANELERSTGACAEAACGIGSASTAVPSGRELRTRLAISARGLRRRASEHAREGLTSTMPPRESPDPPAVFSVSRESARIVVFRGAARAGREVMDQMRSLCIFLALGSVAVAGCTPKANPTDPSDSPEKAACPPGEGMISDGEHANQVNQIKGRGGYWYTFVDKSGSTITPTSGALGGTFSMTKGGRDGSGNAARMYGQIGGGDVVFAGMGLNFVDPKGQYDASAYQGISFWAKKTNGSGNMRLKVPDVNTDPDGGVCSECFNDFGADITLTEQWTQYFFPFSRLKQGKGWGNPLKSSIDATKVYGIQFQVNEKNMVFDIWVDDIQFTGCK